MPYLIKTNSSPRKNCSNGLNKNDLNEILSEVGSVIIQKSPDGLRVSLRGISDDSKPFHNASVSMPTVAINMDGVYSNRKDMSTGLYDLERVEVLYGPQATLYSSNSPGGIVNIETARPKIGIYEAAGTIEYGNYELLHTEGMVNAPISDTIALRAAFTTSIHDGYVSNGGDNEDAKNARLRLLYQPSEAISFLITGEISKVANGLGNGVDAFVDESDVDDPWESDFLIAPPVTATAKRLYGRMDWDMGFASLSVLPSYSTRNADGINIQDMGFQVDTLDVFQESEEKSVEVRLSSTADSFLKWVVGVNYYDYLNYAAGDMQMAWAINDVLPIKYGGTYQPNTDEAQGDPNSSGWGDGTMKGVDVQSTFLITPNDIANLSAFGRRGRHLQSSPFKTVIPPAKPSQNQGCRPPNTWKV